MEKKKEVTDMVLELLSGLSSNAYQKLLSPGLKIATLEQQIRFWRIHMYGAQDEADLPWETAVKGYFGQTIANSVQATLEDLGYTAVQSYELSVRDLRQLLEEHWIPELERMGTSTE